MTTTTQIFPTRAAALAAGWKPPTGTDSTPVTDRRLAETGALLVRDDGTLSDLVLVTEENRLVVLYPPADQARTVDGVLGGAA